MLWDLEREPELLVEMVIEVESLLSCELSLVESLMFTTSRKS